MLWSHARLLVNAVHSSGHVELSAVPTAIAADTTNLRTVQAIDNPR